MFIDFYALVMNHLFAQFLSNKPFFRVPLFSRNRNENNENRKSSSTPPLAPNLRRRFSKMIKAGISGSHLSRQWFNPISKIEEIDKNSNVQIKKVELQPFSLWKPLATGISQLPLASVIDPNRANKATLLRSPDRVIGLANATRQSIRTRTFNFSEAMAFA